jgi:hypothetical protein
LADITEWIERFRNLNAYAKKWQAEETEGIPRTSPGAVHRGLPEEALDFLQPLQEAAGEWKMLILIGFRIFDFGFRIEDYSQKFGTFPEIHN